MRSEILIFLLILYSGSSFAQTDCQKASERAKLDYTNSNFAFHSEELLPVENTYFYVLAKNYKINWYFTDSLKYYNCYDSVMIELLKVKYGIEFLKRARIITDSLDNSKNWRKDAQYRGGNIELLKFISSHLNSDSFIVDTVKTKTRLFVQLEIDTIGKVHNPKVMRGINREIDRKVIDVLKILPDWEPAYLYGKPTRQSCVMPIFIHYK